MKYISSVLVVCLVSALVFSGCKSDSTTASLAGTFIGQTQAMGADSVKSWVTLNDAGYPISVGISFGENALKNLDTTIGSSIELTFPSQAGSAVYNHVSVDWNPKGHEPEPIYGKAHFDFHFYMISKAERAAIIPIPDTVVPLSPSVYPPTYIGDPHEVVPMMGWHLLDSLTPELHGAEFDKTMIWGAYKGNIVFHEPMITKAYLDSKPSFTEVMKQPATYQQTGKYYATSYSIKYNATTKMYSVSLDGLTKR